MKEKQWKISLYDVVAVGLMAAFVFVATRFLSIPYVSPSGKAMLKVANALCLTFGILFGGVRGGLASGFGSALFDLTDPVFAPLAWLTFIRFFLMAFLCGAIAHARGAHGCNERRNMIGAVTGAVFLYVFFIVESILTMLWSGSGLTAAVIAVSPKMLTSAFNMVFSIVVSRMFAPVLRRALATTSFYQKVLRV